MRKYTLIALLSLLSIITNAQLIIRSDASWKAIGSFQPGWTNPWFNDNAWSQALSPSPWVVSPVVPGSQSMWVSPFSDTAYFRKSFFLKSDCINSSCDISADNEFELYVNDSLVGIGKNLGLIYSFNLTPFLRIGKNTIAIKAINWNTGPYLASFLANVDYTSGPEISVSEDDTICPTGQATFGVFQNYNSYLWSNGATSQSITLNASGDYYVEALDNNSCKWVDTVKLLRYQPQALSLGPDQNICEGDQVRLTAPGFVQYNWNVSSDDSTITVSKTGVYGLEAVDTNGCVAGDSMRLRVFSFADISLGDDRVLCKGDTARIIADFPQSVYKWSTGSQRSEISVSSSGTYRVTITNFCGSASDEIDLFFTDLTTFSLMNDTLLCEGTSIELNTNVVNAIYDWSTGDSTMFIEVNEPGTYSVSVKDNCGNEAYDEVNVYSEPNYDAIVPSAFTPNLDGRNEGFRAYIPENRGFQMAIFDRWGKKLFEADNPAEYWDGRYEDKLMPSGVYIFEMSYFDCLRQPQLENGTITLIR